MCIKWLSKNPSRKMARQHTVHQHDESHQKSSLGNINFWGNTEGQDLRFTQQYYSIAVTVIEFPLQWFSVALKAQYTILLHSTHVFFFSCKEYAMLRMYKQCFLFLILAYASFTKDRWQFQKHVSFNQMQNSDSKDAQ